jgi:aldose 1-epimerase
MAADSESEMNDTPSAHQRLKADDPFAIHTQSSPSGLRTEWIGYGAHLRSLRFPDGTHVLARLETAEDYAGAHPAIGSMIGRVANRLASGVFTINGDTFTIPPNEGPHALHGGAEGFHRQVWSVDRETGPDGTEELVFRHSSPAGHQGYPGNLDVTMRSRLTDTELQLRFIAITDAPTPVNLTQHGYWNPAGLFGRPIDQLRLQSPADRYTVVDAALIPTGETLSVEGTAFDFRTRRGVGTPALDVNLLVPGDGIREMARLSDGVRSVTVLSDYPGFQLYTGEALDGVAGMNARAGLAIEPQYPPDAINQAQAPFDTILHPGEIYRHTIIYRFDGPGFPDSETP